MNKKQKIDTDVIYNLDIKLNTLAQNEKNNQNKKLTDEIIRIIDYIDFCDYSIIIIKDHENIHTSKTTHDLDKSRTKYDNLDDGQYMKFMIPINNYIDNGQLLSFIVDLFWDIEEYTDIIENQYDICIEKYHVFYIKISDDDVIS